jgi:ornithine carbamoyltransferase
VRALKRDLTSFALWTQKELADILVTSLHMKAGEPDAQQPLANKAVALIFEKESLRTRVSFEVGIAQLGGHPIFLQQETIGMATRESVHDIGQVLSQYAALIVARTEKHQTCIQLAESATVPVINAMTDLLHPCQILADAMTLQELNKFTPTTKIVFVGDGNNMANSWLELAEKIPLDLTLSCPAGYEPHPEILEQARSSAVSTIRLVQNPIDAVADADVIYTDVWFQARGGPDDARRLNIFRPYQVNKQLLSGAKRECVVMHRLPANRGEEISSDVLDGKQSVALDQAHNRLHVQKAIMRYLLSDGKAD